MTYSGPKTSKARVALSDDPLATIRDDKLLTRREASDYLAMLGVWLAPATLAKLFCSRTDGPPVVHFGRYPRYRVGDLRNWALARLTAPRRSSLEAIRTIEFTSQSAGEEG
jgi:hypothetical protein